MSDAAPAITPLRGDSAVADWPGTALSGGGPEAPNPWGRDRREVPGPAVDLPQSAAGPEDATALSEGPARHAAYPTDHSPSGRHPLSLTLLDPVRSFASRNSLTSFEGTPLRRDTPMSETARRHSAFPPPNRRRALAFISIAQLLVILDATIVNITLPSAQQDLGIPDGNRLGAHTFQAVGEGHHRLRPRLRRPDRRPLGLQARLRHRPGGLR